MSRNRDAGTACSDLGAAGDAGSRAMQRVIDVAAGLVFREGKLLITQRRPQDHLGGLWEFPGGKREPDETFERCLARELLEELGIEVEVGRDFGAVTHAYPEQTVHLKFFLCRWLAHEPQPLGCHALAWISREEIDQFVFPAADTQLLEQLRGLNFRSVF